MALITISGYLKDNQGNPLASTDVTFDLVNYAPNLPTVSGTNVLVPISTTLTTDATGLFSESIQGNDTISPASTLYQVSFGSKAMAIYSLIGAGPIDLDSYPPVSVIPVPAGPVPTSILTGNNIFSGTNAFTNNDSHSGTETFTGNVVKSSSGLFTPGSMHLYLESLINSADPLTEYQFYSGAAWQTEAITGAIIVPNGASTFIQGVGVQGYANNLSSTAPAIGVQGMARSAVNGASVHGGIFIGSDGGAGFPNNNYFGAETYVLATNTTSAPVAHIVGGAFTAQPTTAIGIYISQPAANSGGPYHWTKGLRFDVGATLAPTIANFSAGKAGIEFNPIASGPSQPSQGICFLSNFSDSTGNLACIGELATGNVDISTSRANTGLSINGGTGLVTSNQTGTGDIVLAYNPTLTIPVLGVATGTSLNIVEGSSAEVPSVVAPNFTIIGSNDGMGGSGTAKIYAVIGATHIGSDTEGDKAYAGWFKAAASNTTSAEIAIHAETADAAGVAGEFTKGGVVVGAPSSGSKGTGTLNVQTAYYANGTIGVTQTVGTPATLATIGGIVTTFTITSDERLKDHTSYEGGLSEILALHPIRYKWNERGQEVTGDASGTEYVGFGAQDAQKAIPESQVGKQVAKDGTEYLGFDDRPIIAALVNAVKELKAEIEELKRNK